MASEWHEGGVEKETEEMQHEVIIMNRWIKCFSRKCVLDVNLNMSVSGVASLFLELCAINGSGDEVCLSKIIIIISSKVA